jgi:pentatricopeptide repeat protein
MLGWQRQKRERKALEIMREMEALKNEPTGV